MDPRRRRTIDALLRAAQELLVEHSIENLTVEDIARHAGVAVGSIYNHFGSKAGLHAAVVQQALDVDRRFMDLAYTPDRDPLAQLYAAAEEYLRFYLENPDYFRMLAFPTDPGQYPAGRELADRLAQSVDEQNARMVDAIRRAVDDGALRPVDPEAVATVLWSAWNGIISLGWRPDRLRRSEAELRELLQTATDVIANGLLLRQSVRD